jgi:hypothetical protein
MIIFEILGKIFIEFIFEGILRGFWNLIGNGLNKLDELIFGNKKPSDPTKILEKKYLYKKIELTDNLNEELKSGRKGAILEIIDKNRVLAEFYDGNGNQIERNNELVFEIKMNQFKLKK